MGRETPCTSWAWRYTFSPAWGEGVTSPAGAARQASPSVTGRDPSATISWMSRPVMSEPRQSPLCVSGSSSRGSSAASFWSPPVVSNTADAGTTSPSGGTTTELAGFAVASLDAAIDGEELLLAMEDWEEATGTERG